MRLVALIALALAACGPNSPTRFSRTDSEPRVLRPPPNAPPDPIGTVRPGDRSCTEDRDCKAGETCFAPDFTPSTGPHCKTDNDCTDGQLCSGTTCTPPCTSTSCPAGNDCRDHRCTPLPCTDPAAAICPQNHRCNPSSGACERLPCSSRSQCDTGVCYQRRCFAHDAFCMAPPPSQTP